MLLDWVCSTAMAECLIALASLLCALKKARALTPQCPEPRCWSISQHWKTVYILAYIVFSYVQLLAVVKAELSPRKYFE